MANGSASVSWQNKRQLVGNLDPLPGKRIEQNRDLVRYRGPDTAVSGIPRFWRYRGTSTAVARRAEIWYRGCRTAVDETLEDTMVRAVDDTVHACT